MIRRFIGRFGLWLFRRALPCYSVQPLGVGFNTETREVVLRVFGVHLHMCPGKAATLARAIDQAAQDIAGKTPIYLDKFAPSKN